MIGILGGTFDPVHHAHLRCALELQQALGLEQVRFVPCRVPPHRGTPFASAEQRLAMLELAIEGQPGFVADDRELRRDGPSYTVDTLLSFREEFGADLPLCLIVGMDAFLGLDSWNRWEQLTGLAHLVVMRRPGLDAAAAGPALEALLRERLVDDPQRLRAAPAGGILLWTVTQIEISGTRIRDLIARGRNVRYLLPDRVLDHIRRERLYLDARPGAGGEGK
jgi:nicotinate-nucleotide adenylyltransferase